MNGISNRNATLLMIFIILLSAFFCGTCFWDAKKVSVIDMEDYKEGDDLYYKLDYICLKDDMLKVRGWIVQAGQEVETYDTSLVLHDPVKGMFFELPTQYEKRSDITELLNDGTDYSDSGFLSNTFIDQFDLTETQYEICIAYKNNGASYMLHTDQYIGQNWNTKKVAIIDVGDYKRGEWNGLRCGMEEISAENNTLRIRGWVMQVGQETNNDDISVILYDPDSDIFFCVPTEYEKRIDVTEYFNEGVNYDNSGFLVNMSLDGFEQDTKQYEVCISYRSGNSSYLLHIGQYIGGGIDV